MNNERTQYLLAKYPKLFTKITVINCDDGWFNLIDIACNLMQGYADRNQSDLTSQVTFQQITTKFGSLRLYFSDVHQHEYLAGVAAYTEKLSLTICEVSGDAGFLHRDSQSVKTISGKVAIDRNMTPIIRTNAPTIY